MEIEHFSHQHPLIELEKTDNDEDIECSGCKLAIQVSSSSAYACKQCKFYLHNSCAKLPSQIHHHFHPQHPLAIRFLPYDDQFHHCTICNRHYSSALAYHCADCDFLLDLPCSSLEPTVHFEFEDHVLHLFWLEGLESPCYKCWKNVESLHFRCVVPRCTHIFHIHCAPFSLPETLNSESRHFHPLNFVESHVEDDSDDNYCDACEKKRFPETPIYYCDKCNYMAHVGCCVRELLPSLIAKYENEAKPERANFIIVKLNRELAELHQEETSLQEELKEIEEKLLIFEDKRDQFMKSKSSTQNSETKEIA